MTARFLKYHQSTMGQYPVSIVLWCMALLLMQACNKNDTMEKRAKEDAKDQKEVLLQIPKGFPYPEIPADNKPTLSRIELGKQLFSDPILSRDSTISCSSCHKADLFFTDNLKVSTGINGRTGDRNAPSLINVAYQPVMFWDGGNPTLEQQVLAPIDNHNELDFDVNLIVEKLKKHKTYPSLFQRAYNRSPDVFSLTRAIACFERTLIGGTSRYDKFTEKNDSTLLTIAERRGLDLFFGEKGECFHCHGGFNFTDNSFQNNGLYLQYADSGRARITNENRDIGKFKVPSLRNIAKTSPYMHDGSKATLEEVLTHYAGGVKKHPNRSITLQSIRLTEQDKLDIIAFLKTLTDE